MKKKNKLELWEYQEIQRLYSNEGRGIREIGQRLSRDPSTISRALRRDLHPCPGVWRRMDCYEKGKYSWEKARRRRSANRRRLRLKTERLRRIVIYLLSRKHWSPEQISNFLRHHGLQVSAKAIYNFIKKERSHLYQYLRLRGKPRRQRVARPRSYFRDGVPAKKSIHERGPIIGSGHWEIDTIHSRKGTSGAVLTLREQFSKHRFCALLPDLTARSVMAVLMPFFQALPPHMRRTLTSDNGSEFSELYKLEKILPDFKVYYCDPYKACQRGSVENANGEVRWYLPKKTDFSKVLPEELRTVEFRLNAKPMRCLNYQSARAVYKQALLMAA